MIGKPHRNTFVGGMDNRAHTIIPVLTDHSSPLNG